MSTPGRWHHVDETERRKWQNPEAILQEAGLTSGMTLIDIGCGEGFFTLPAARVVSASGKIYSVDVDQIALEELQNKASAEGLSNIETVVGAAEDIVPCSECADIVFLGIVLHDFKNPYKVLQNAHKMLKKDGRLVNLDWKKEGMSFGPPLAKRFDEDTSSLLIKSAGFIIKSIRDSGIHHYIIIANPL